MGNDGLANIHLPDTHDCRTVVRNATGVDQPAHDRERPNRRGEVPAVAAPVHEGLVDRHLPEQVIHIMFRRVAAGKYDGLAGARGGATHSVGMLAVRVGAADYPQQQGVTHRAGDPGRLRKILQAEKHAFAGATAHVDCRNPDLGCMSHAADSRKSWANRCSTPPAA